MNLSFLNSIAFKPINHTPLWLMRQAGRYLPEYRKLRETAGSFMGLCQNPDFAAEATLQPLRRFDLDAAIIFSDILVIPDALGLGLYFVEGEGPKFKQPLVSDADVDALTLDGMLEKLSYVFDTVRNVKASSDCKVPLIGFSGSPFTLACYMLEGAGSKDYQKVKTWLYNKPVESHKLLSLLADAVIIYLNEQIKSGVDAVMIFDSWGGVLSASQYYEFSLPYLQKIVQGLTKVRSSQDIPNIVFTKGGGIWLDEIRKIGANCIGLDWTMEIATARNIVGSSVALQGNLDPVILSVGDKSAIKQAVTKILNDYKVANNGLITGHVFNLGHGILPSANPDNVAYLVDMVHEISQLN